MGVKERREREKQHLRDEILSSVRQIAKSQGWASLTIRSIAQKVEYSPSMIYEYFDSKEAIMFALFTQGFNELKQDFQRAAAATDDPDQRLHALLDAYWDFSQRNPDLYQLMHNVGGVQVRSEEDWQPILAATEIVQQALQSWAASVNTTLPDVWGAAETMWSLIHGFISNVMNNRIHGGDERARRLAHEAAASLLSAWKHPVE